MMRKDWCAQARPRWLQLEVKIDEDGKMIGKQRDAPGEAGGGVRFVGLLHTSVTC